MPDTIIKPSLSNSMKPQKISDFFLQPFIPKEDSKMKAANKNTIPITSESDILCAFRNLTSSYDERTLHKWINFFKKCMYYASSDYSNPMFLSLTYNAVKKERAISL